MSTRKDLEALMGQVEEMWAHQDALFQVIDRTDAWGQKHGPDWTFADVPYHLTYCNLDLIARPIELGPDFPLDERLTFATMEELHAWNERNFAARPPSRTGRESWSKLRESWREIRRLSEGMTDADLERPYWTPFMGGDWLTARHGFLWSLSHDWSEFMQLRIHMGRSQPVPSPEITSHYLGAMIGGMFPLFLNTDAAKGKEFIAVMAFTDPGVGAYSIQVAEGRATVVPGAKDGAHLVITQSAETFEKTMRGIQPMPEALQAGAIAVDNPENLLTFGELFPISL